MAFLLSGEPTQVRRFSAPGLGFEAAPLLAYPFPPIPLLPQMEKNPRILSARPQKGDALNDNTLISIPA
jgi:hypothetical protein